ncbi:MAG: asparagine synthase (glutamine-hydrolyzing) [Vicinamibacterales bacterium]|jgi:asparagine synthase (glutamine-hydrolysing)
MCGICGTIAIDGSLDPRLRAAIGPMTAALAHRGPDGDGIYTGPAVAFGHRRLAIIDRAGGDQPMANAERTRWIVFNGEIYNHRSLRTRLMARGHTFSTVSDTEVILRAYDEYGADCVNHLEGMFAFALYDAVTGEALLARDRLGKKPLYYAVLGGALHFASEIKSIRHSPAWDPAIDLSALEGYLSLGYFLAPATIYRHVHQVEPGHRLRLRRGGVDVQQYWDVEDFDSDTRPESQVLPDLEELLSSAVRERLESEVPIGAFLSGGIDSGLVVSYMSDASATPVISTTADFGGGIYDEAQVAGLTARHIGTWHYCDTVTPELEPVIDRIIGSFDQPFADASAIPTYYLSAMARRHVTVALSGDGGDEAFGGYAARYVAHGLESRVRRHIGAPVGRTAAWLGERWPRSTRLPRWMRAGTVLENLGRDDATAYYADLCMLKPFQARALLGQDPARDPRRSPVFEQVTEPYRRCPSASAIQRAQYADLKIYLPNDVLVKVDRMSMAHGLEVRSPLLDRRVVEAAFRIPATTKLVGRETKRLLRRLARSRLPAQVVDRPKHGFDAPIGRWIAGPCLEMFRSDVLGPSSLVPTLVDVAEVRRLLDDHCAGRRDYSFALWALWVLARWADHRGDVEPAVTRTHAAPVPY